MDFQPQTQSFFHKNGTSSCALKSIFSCQNLPFCDLMLSHRTPKLVLNEEVVILMKGLNFSRDKRKFFPCLKKINWIPMRVVPTVKSLTS